VKNHTAKLNLMAMRKGEQVFFYHSNEGLEIVGIVEVIKEHYPWIPGEPWVLVDFKAVKPLPKPVTLAAVKAEPKLAKMALVTSFRLSVQPVTDEEWDIVCKMGGL
jgi:predicted RNA-binding protein with PUA-like domain